LKEEGGNLNRKALFSIQFFGSVHSKPVSFSISFFEFLIYKYLLLNSLDS